LEARRAFLEEHLLNWVPDFADDVQRVARTGFYRALADIVLGVLETDQGVIGKKVCPEPNRNPCDKGRLHAGHSIAQQCPSAPPLHLFR